jgi:Uma2 family endonuclease
VEDVYAMVRAGVLDEHERIELVDGVLLDMSPIGAPHDDVVSWLTRHLVRTAGDEWEVRIQSMFMLAGDRGFLLPDVSVFLALPRPSQPTTAELIVEVAETSQRRYGEKEAEYAAAGVAEYWIVDLAARSLAVHHAPRRDGYAERSTRRDGEEVTPLLGGPPVAVSELLGPKLGP